MIVRVNRPRTRFISPRESSCRSSCASSKRPLRISRDTLRTIPTRITRLSAAITYRNVPDTLVPIQVRDAVQRRAVVLHRAAQRTNADREQERQREHDDECPSENQKPTLSGRLPSAISLRVVLSIAEMWSASNAWRRPSVYAVSPSPMRERPGRAEVVVVRRDEHDQDEEPDHVQPDHRAGHAGDRPPLVRRSASRSSAA